MPKRTREDSDHAATSAAKKHRKGFTVGPDNLPEGQHKLKTQLIKRNLIEKAKLKKEYAKVKAQHEAETGAVSADASNEPHPDRQIMIDRAQNEPEEVEEKSNNKDQGQSWRRERRPRTVPFEREQRQAQRSKDEAEERQRAREEAERERQQKIQDREKFRKAMSKAKTPGRDGKRKLGRESTILLDKVKKMLS